MDIGLEKNGFLHADDIVMPGVEVARRGRAGGKGKRITELLKPGQEILVQAVKDPLKTKGPRLSMQLSIAGPLPRLRAPGRGRRRVAPARRQGARAAAQGRPRGSTSARAGRSSAPPPRAPSGRTSSARSSTCTSCTRCCRSAPRRPPRRPWSSRRPTSRCAWCATSSPSSSSARSWTTPSSTTAWSPSSRAPRPSCSTRLELYKDEQEPLFERYGVERGDPVDAAPARGPALGRLPDHRLRRGDDGDRRQLGLVHRPRQGRPARGHDHQDQPRGGRGGRAPAAAARHRRHHRHRLHRHVAGAQPRRGAQDAAQGARRGPHEDLRGGDLAARAGGDDAPERDRRRARDPHQDLPHLRRARAWCCPRRRWPSTSSAACASSPPSAPAPRPS